MLVNTGVYWFLMGMLTVVVAAGLRAFAARRGWVMTWWKWVLAALWYGVFGVTLLTLGTLAGEGEGQAGLRIALLGLFVCAVLGVGLWRVFGHNATRPAAA